MTAFAVPTPSNCPVTDVRPFAIGVKDGKVYVGLVCTAESTQNRAQLRAYVYAFANGAFASTPALEIDLAGYRTSGNIQWQYWLNRTTFDPNDVNKSSGKWAQPWLTDIAFDGNDMILAFRDRDADQFGTTAGGPTPTDSKLYSGIARGDILRACANGSGGWQLENQGACGGVTTAGATGYPEGPGGGEYYYQDEQVAQHPALRQTGPGPEALLLQAERWSELQHHLQRLAPLDRQVLVLHYWGYLPYGDIAAATGLTVSAVKSRLHRARARLAALLHQPARLSSAAAEAAPPLRSFAPG